MKRGISPASSDKPNLGLSQGLSGKELLPVGSPGATDAEHPPHTKARRTRHAKNGRRDHCLPSVPSQQVQALFNSLFKVLCIFPSRYLFAIGLGAIFSFRWNLPPVRAAIPSNPTLRAQAVRHAFPDMNGTITLHGALFQETLSGTVPGVASVDYNSRRILSMSSSRFSRPY